MRRDLRPGRRVWQMATAGAVIGAALMAGAVLAAGLSASFTVQIDGVDGVSVAENGCTSTLSAGDTCTVKLRIDTAVYSPAAQDTIAWTISDSTLASISCVQVNSALTNFDPAKPAEPTCANGSNLDSRTAGLIVVVTAGRTLAGGTVTIAGTITDASG